MKNFKYFYDAWCFLYDFPEFNKGADFPGHLDISVVKVNPKTGKIDDDSILNTETEVWLECGGYDEESDLLCHDVRLDVGAPTFEEAIVKLANKTLKYYGDYRKNGN